VAALLAAAGVAVEVVGRIPAVAEKVRVRADGQTLVRIDRGRPGPPVLDAGGLERAATVLAGARAVLAADYGRGLLAAGPVRDLLAAGARARPLVWDPHPRGAEPVPGAWLTTPNRSEAAASRPGADPSSLADLTAAATDLCRRQASRATAVTLGAGGALLVMGDGPPMVCPCPKAAEGDVSGAGDAFAVGTALALGDGAVLSEAVAAGVALGAEFVGGLHRRTWTDAAPAPAAPDADDGDPVAAVVARTRAAGGTVVMTGGCFDLLHAGHVQLLTDARSLGDCLVVCLNGDDSVRRLKGAGRPLVPAVDRARVVRALGSVDEVVVFDEATPVAVLDRYRPDVFVKGGDYSGAADLPETAALAAWGGQVVVVPYLAGRSTSRLLQEVLDAH
jgi:rfaE bifunctional protein nucleotidyltransferase chain/domain